MVQWVLELQLQLFSLATEEEVQMLLQVSTGEIHSYNVNTHDTIIRITTTGSNNQGIVALIERI